MGFQQWGRLLRNGHLRRPTCVSLFNGPASRPAVRWQTESKIISSPFSDVEISTDLIDEYVWKNLDRWADKDALVCGLTNRKFTFAEARLACKRFAASLQKRGATPGQVLAILLPNIPEFPVASFGAIEAGLIVTTVNPAYTPYELAHQFKDSGAVVVVTTAGLLANVTAAQRLAGGPSLTVITVNLGEPVADGTWDFAEMIDAAADSAPTARSCRKASDAVFMPYSSGTTGLSKGVVLSHRNILANMAQTDHPEISHIVDTTANYQDVMPAILPFYHIYGLTMLLMKGMSKGCKLVSLPKLESQPFLNTLKQHKATILYVVPPVVLLLGQNKNVTQEHFDSLRIICNGAGPVKQTDAEKLMDRSHKKNLRFYQAYGMTECSPVVFVSRNSNLNDYLTVGPPVSNTLTKIVDPNDPTKEFGPGEVGEILIKGPQVMLGYHNNPKATADTISPDGWLSSGDVGYYNDQKEFYIVDRIKELIKVKGYQVPPAELEGVLRTHPNVMDAAVVGVPDARTGEAPLAFVMLDPNLPAVAEDELQRFVADRVAPYKQIAAGVRFVESLPKSAAGKILRRVLKDGLKDGLGDGPPRTTG